MLLYGAIFDLVVADRAIYTLPHFSNATHSNFSGFLHMWFCVVILLLYGAIFYHVAVDRAMYTLPHFSATTHIDFSCFLHMHV